MSTRTGGVPQTNKDLMSALQEQIETLVLQGDPDRVQLFRFDGQQFVLLENCQLKISLKAFPHRSEEYDKIVAHWIIKYAIELVHVRHISWHSLGLAEIAKILNIPFVYSIHDFYSICPTVNLIDNSGKYCAGNCTETPSDCNSLLWRELDFPKLKNNAVFEWRKQFKEFILLCDSLIFTSQSSFELLLQHFSFIKNISFNIVPHGRNFLSFEQYSVPVDKNEMIKILIPGNIGISKGIQIVNELADYTSEKKIEIHVLGKVENKFIKNRNAVHWHGPYTRDDFASKVSMIRPHIGGIFSIWPETYCHTLTELWSCGIPVIGFNYGAVAERIRETKAGWLAATPTANAVLNIVDKIRRNPKVHEEAVNSVISWQNEAGKKHNIINMANEYLSIYKNFVH